MEQKIQIKHPQGKKAVSISIDKYELLKQEITEFLSLNTEGAYTEISKAINQKFSAQEIKFDGSLNWYLEWVKLDLETREIIKRIDKKTTQKYQLTKKMKKGSSQQSVLQ